MHYLTLIVIYLLAAPAHAEDCTPACSFTTSALTQRYIADRVANDMEMQNWSNEQTVQAEINAAELRAQVVPVKQNDRSMAPVDPLSNQERYWP